MTDLDKKIYHTPLSTDELLDLADDLNKSICRNRGNSGVVMDLSGKLNYVIYRLKNHPTSLGLQSPGNLPGKHKS